MKPKKRPRRSPGWVRYRQKREEQMRIWRQKDEDGIAYNPRVCANTSPFHGAGPGIRKSKRRIAKSEKMKAVTGLATRAKHWWEP